MGIKKLKRKGGRERGSAKEKLTDLGDCPDTNKHVQTVVEEQHHAMAREKRKSVISE